MLNRKIKITVALPMADVLNERVRKLIAIRALIFDKNNSQLRDRET